MSEGEALSSSDLDDCLAALIGVGEEGRLLDGGGPVTASKFSLDVLGFEETVDARDAISSN